ncbi:MAG TPA: dihydroxyacetone kinase subunit DhaL [Bacteroidales bacterium]|nr:dihydroxyacetone kinase subunit DhaL [Bacteroidales bacterium]
MKTFSVNDGARIIDNLVVTFRDNKQYLSDMDGLIGDGDHGINMNKGFTLVREELDKNPGNLVHGLKTVSKILMMKIGGSMGPLYGKFFGAMAASLSEKENIGIQDILTAFQSAQGAISTISQARPGDKTLMDTLVPATEALMDAIAKGRSEEECLAELKRSALEGFESTKEMVARIGRASRLAERSRGVHDPGAASCYLIIETFCDTITNLLK